MEEGTAALFGILIGFAIAIGLAAIGMPLPYPLLIGGAVGLVMFKAMLS